MVSYDDLAGGLEDGWAAARLHEHTLVEAVVPDHHERTFRAELFPDHPEPLTDATMPPWVEVSFSWTAVHQLRYEGHASLDKDPLEVVWVYNVPVHGMIDRSDGELVRMFRRCIQTAYIRLIGDESIEPPDMAVEVRRTFVTAERRPTAAFIQLVSSNVTDFTDIWMDQNAQDLRELLAAEFQLCAAVIHALAEVFTPGGRGSYMSVESA